MFWTPAKLLLVTKRVRAYNAAITTAAKYMAPDEAAYLPRRLTVEEVKQRVIGVQAKDNRWENVFDRNGNPEPMDVKAAQNNFRRIVGYNSDKRTSQLTRILRKNNPDALTLVKGDNGRMTTDYANKERRYKWAADKRRMNREIQDLIDKAGRKPGEEMSAPEEAAALDGTDMVPPDVGEPDDSVEDMDDATYNQWEEEDAQADRIRASVANKYDKYLTTWIDPQNRHAMMQGYDAVVDALEWLFTQKPRVLMVMFNSGANEMEIPWIIDSDGDGTGAPNPFASIPFDTRHNQAVTFITQHAIEAGW